MSGVRVGIVSDTHGLLRPELFHLLEGVDHILHAGDVGRPDILTELETLAPVTAVRGNTDGLDIHAVAPESARTELAGRTVVVVHGHLTGTSPAALVDHAPDADVIVFGHTHRPEVLEHQGVLLLNPGSCGPRRFTQPVSLALADFGPEPGPGGIRVRHLEMADD
ncbi:MAG: metallophosphoesterase [Gemmatimonadales bacterium]|nr:MAG: metallophosphoesterase [Gemmatimonadales bacterium]